MDYPYLARRIKASMWRSAASSDSIGADAITEGLRTWGDTLSCWESTGAEDDIIQVGMTMLCCPYTKTIETIDVIWYPKSRIQEIGIEFRSETSEIEAQTLVRDMVSRHMNLLNLNLRALCSLAELTLELVKREEYCRKVRAKEIKKQIAKAIEQKRINPNQFHVDLRARLVEDKVMSEP